VWIEAQFANIGALLQAWPHRSVEPLNNLRHHFIVESQGGVMPILGLP
jgi:hypothetical protein